MIGNTSNIYGSYLYPSSAAPQYVFGGATIAGVGVVCMACAITMRFILLRENKKLDKVGREGDFALEDRVQVYLLRRFICVPPCLTIILSWSRSEASMDVVLDDLHNCKFTYH